MFLRWLCHNIWCVLVLIDYLNQFFVKKKKRVRGNHYEDYKACGHVDVCEISANVRILTKYKQVLWKSVVHISAPWTPWTLKLSLAAMAIWRLFHSFYRIWPFGVKCDTIAQSWEIKMTKMSVFILYTESLLLYYYSMCSMDTWKIGTLHRVSLLAMKVLKERNMAFW